MSEIPADVMETARKVLDGYLRTPISPDEAIARAILAERERCARIVEIYADHPNELVAFIAGEIAESVRR